jgi:hypothetical protein
LRNTAFRCEIYFVTCYAKRQIQKKKNMFIFNIISSIFAKEL